MKSFKNFISSVKAIPAKMAQWQKEFEEEQRRLEAERKRLAEHEAKLKREADERKKRIEAVKLERERNAFEQDVKKNKKKWHEYLKNSNEQIKTLKKEIGDLHGERKELLHSKKMLHNEMDDLSASRSSAISASRADADDRMFGSFNRIGVSSSRYSRNHARKSSHGDRAVSLKYDMDSVGSKIKSIKGQIGSVQYSINQNKKKIEDISAQREKVKKVLFTK
jgi:chromosome segregation ATPase